MDLFCYLCLSLPNSFMQPCGHLVLRKGCPLGSLVCDAFLFFVTFR